MTVTLQTLTRAEFRCGRVICVVSPDLTTVHLRTEGASSGDSMSIAMTDAVSIMEVLGAVYDWKKSKELEAKAKP